MQKENGDTIMKFYTQYDNISIPTNSGNEIIEIKEKRTNPITGEITFEITGKRNIYQEIQEASIGASLEEQIQKLLDEDTEITEQQYLDTTSIPEHFTEREELKNNNFEKIKKLEEELKKAKEKLEENENEKKQNAT